MDPISNNNNIHYERQFLDSIAKNSNSAKVEEEIKDVLQQVKAKFQQMADPKQISVSLALELQVLLNRLKALQETYPELTAKLKKEFGELSTKG